MTSIHVLARALAAALLDGPWELERMIERLRVTIGEERPWMVPLAELTLGQFEVAPDRVYDLACWLFAEDTLREAAREELHVRRWATPAPQMSESPWRVPALATLKELAVWLGVDVRTLTVLADERGLSRGASDPRMRHYRYVWIAKRSGGHRLLEAPKARLRTIQRYVLDGILANIPPHGAAHGFRTGHSILSFVTPHTRRALIVRVDLQAFFTSIFASRVSAIYRAAGYPDEVAGVLAALSTHRTPTDVLAAAPTRDPVALARLRTPHLPQGAPTSGALANLAAYRLDVRVDALASAVGGQYTRYADDLVLSGNRELVRSAPTLVARLGAIALEEGFSPNFRKTRVMTSSTCQRLVGLVVNDKISLPRAELQRLRAILHNCTRTGPAAQNREGHPNFRAHLLGRIAWVASIDRVKGERLTAVFDRIRWDEDGPRT
jgi:hypothetical protein